MLHEVVEGGLVVSECAAPPGWGAGERLLAWMTLSPWARALPREVACTATCEALIYTRAIYPMRDKAIVPKATSCAMPTMPFSPMDTQRLARIQGF